LAISIALAFTFSCSSGGDDGGGGNFEYGSLPYKGKDYKTIEIGTQTWLAENLNYDVPDNDTDVCYGNNSANCVTYGRLYSWATAMALPDSCNSSSCASQIDIKHQGICPNDWHIPNYADWTELIVFVDGSSKYLRAKSGWNKGANGQDKFGFSALPGGYGVSNGYFDDVGDYGYWWSASQNGGNALYVEMHGEGYGKDGSLQNGAYLRSVRCVKD
jgi:uncharacterized protein (TIGR02145 family)